MNFAQSWMLYALPAVLLPLIIHLLNRLRYKTVPWAAMMFLLKANKAATRRARIRQYLLLASRMALLLFFLWAMARPLVGGWLGAAAGGAPEVVMVLLDRSASMEAGGPERAVSKRGHALNLLAQAAKQSQGSRFVLLENVKMEPLEIGDVGALSGMQLAGPTDTSADLQSMFLKAAEYLVKNNPGSAEIWVASDFQASNWKPNASEWRDITARFLGLPQVPRVRILDLSMPAQNNVSLALKSVELKPGKDAAAPSKLSVAMELKSTGNLDRIPVSVMRDGVVSQQEVGLEAATQRHVLKYDVTGDAAEKGYGELRLPADEHPGDNAAWFVYAPPVPLKVVVVGEGSAVGRLKIAAVPDPSVRGRQVLTMTTAEASGIPWKETALIIWQAPAPEGKLAQDMLAFVDAGGCLLVFPNGDEKAFTEAGLSWKSAEMAAIDGPFRVSSWDEQEGPLAKTDSGASLSVAKLESMRRQIPLLADSASRKYASFGDGQPFLLGKKQGNGQLYACATQADVAWSNLGDGLVLLPMVQRMLNQGAARLAPPRSAVVGEWKPTDAADTWVGLGADAAAKDWRWNAGIYQKGAQLLALNRPAAEDEADVVPAEQIPTLLTGLKVEILSQAMEVKADRLQNEIWQVFIILAMVFMCVEMLLATSKGIVPASRQAVV